MPEVDINDYLKKDSIRVPEQEFAIISVISPKSRQKADHLAVKIKGVFSTMEDAKKHATKLQKFDDAFDIFVVEMYAWLCLPPETEKIGEKHYSDEKLEELITAHDKEMEDAQASFEKHRKEQKQAGKLKGVPELADKPVDESSSESQTTTDKPVDESSLV